MEVSRLSHRPEARARRRPWGSLFWAAAAVLGLVLLLVPVTSGAQVARIYSWGSLTTIAGYTDIPVAVAGVPGTVVQISTSNYDTYALTSAGTLWAWGGDAYGSLGDGSVSDSDVSTPVEVQFPPGVSIASLASPMPFDVGMAIDTNGDVWVWGDGGPALCNPAITLEEDIPLPQMITAPALEGDVTLASGAYNHALYYTSSGTLYACGANPQGQLGDGTTTSSTTPVAVVGLPSEPVVSLQSSWRDSGALMADGSYWDWGYNAYGQLGDGSTAASDVPVQVGLPAAVAKVAVGGSLPGNGQSVAILVNGSVYSWGADTNGQSGIGHCQAREVLPVAVKMPKNTTFVAVASGGASDYAIDSTGNLWAWGRDGDGQLGIASTKKHSSPVSLNFDASEVSSTAFNVAALAPAG